MNNTPVSLSRLESHLWEAANILRGTVDAADFKTYVFPLLFFKRISDVHDEEYHAALAESGGDEEYALFPQNYRFQIPDDCHWRDVRAAPTNVGLALQNATRGIEKANPETLYGIFGDAGWTNRDRLPDSLLHDLIEHFSAINLGNEIAKADLLGQSYEYLIKKFADATNKKAGEFYTPRSVVRLMVNILDPREGESIYDPACGTGGMLLEAIHHVRERHEDDRTLWGKLFGQEKNLTTSAIARMNLFLHGAADFQIVRGDTLRQPAFFSGDSLATFDCVIANPPFSLEKWGEGVWASDPYGRNFAGMPPAASGDYAWVQHMITSLAPSTGRMAVVLPHGALFRMGKEGAIRKKILQMDLLEAVIGLGPNLFYGTGLAACILVFRQRKPKERQRRVLILDASREFKTGRAQNELLPEHVERIHGIEDFQIVRGDTLSEPKLVEADRLMRFDVCLANPPYSVKQWDRGAFASDPWGRNRLGTPPQGRADYAFWQHILASLAHRTGRCAILFPHGVLFRQEEAEMRRKLMEADLIECVLGLGPNLFYNSPMEACVVICRSAKLRARAGRILFINAVNEVTRERAQSFLTDDHIERIVAAYQRFEDEPGFTRVVSLAEIRAKDGNLSIPLYVAPASTNGTLEVKEAGSLAGPLSAWLKSRGEVAEALTKVLPPSAEPKLETHLCGAATCDLLKCRPRWHRVRFGDVVENLNETVRDPAEAGFERFIGLEHLEPGSLHIRAWGSVADGTTFTRRCRPGQVLFGKRRAYQRKVAVAEFDAVVSGDIYVLAPKNDRLLPKLLPFLCLSERFFQHAVGTSAGSLSPRTNWSSLASFEFDLPPLGQQRRIAELLWAVDEVHQSRRSLIAALDGCLESCCSRQFAAVSSRNTSLGNLIRDGVVELRTGPFGTVLAASSYTSSGVPVINPVHMDGDSLDTSSGPFVSEAEADRLSRYQMRPGDIVMCRKRHVGRMVCVLDEYDGFIVGSDCIRIRAEETQLLSRFLLLYLRSGSIQRWLVRATTGSVMPGMNEAILGKLEIPVPEPEVQEQVIASLDQILRAIQILEANANHVGQLLQGLQNQVFAEDDCYSTAA